MCSYTRYPHLAAKPRPLLPPDVVTRNRSYMPTAVKLCKCSYMHRPRIVSWLIFKRADSIFRAGWDTNQ
jgi:hypothetical protein